MTATIRVRGSRAVPFMVSYKQGAVADGSHKINTVVARHIVDLLHVGMSGAQQSTGFRHDLFEATGRGDVQKSSGLVSDIFIPVRHISRKKYERPGIRA